jgi:hypothetical protein
MANPRGAWRGRGPGICGDGKRPSQAIADLFTVIVGIVVLVLAPIVYGF